MFSRMLKIAVDAPIPSASVTTATIAKPGAFTRFLSAYRMSCPSDSIEPPMAFTAIGAVWFPTGIRPCYLLSLKQVGRSGLLPLGQESLHRYEPEERSDLMDVEG